MAISNNRLPLGDPFAYLPPFTKNTLPFSKGTFTFNFGFFLMDPTKNLIVPSELAFMHLLPPTYYRDYTIISWHYILGWIN